MTGSSRPGRATVKGDHAVDQGRTDPRPRVDVIGQRHARFAVMLADKAALFPQAELHESRVADDDALQSAAARRHRADAGPPRRWPGPISGCGPAAALAFDGVAGLGILQTAGRPPCAREDRAARRDDAARARAGPCVDERFERLRSKDQRAELRRARQIVADAVPRRIFARSGPLLLGIDDGTTRARRSIRQVKPRPVSHS